MKKYYNISRIIMNVLAIVLSFIMFWNEHISFKIVGILVFTIATFLAGFITTPISRKMICIGDGISNKYLKLIYYISILPLFLLISYGIYILIMFIFKNGNTTTDYVEALGIALMGFFLGIIMVIVVFVPYIQTILVLIIRKVKEQNIKHKSN